MKVNFKKFWRNTHPQQFNNKGRAIGTHAQGQTKWKFKNKNFSSKNTIHRPKNSPKSTPFFLHSILESYRDTWVLISTSIEVWKRVLYAKMNPSGSLEKPYSSQKMHEQILLFIPLKIVVLLSFVLELVGTFWNFYGVFLTRKISKAYRRKDAYLTKFNESKNKLAK